MILKFRVWNPKEGKYYYTDPECGPEISFEYQDLTFAMTDIPDLSNYDVMNPTIVEQFISIKDRNGKEIYDGDIVKATMVNSPNPFTDIFPVGFNPQRCGFTIGAFIPGAYEDIEIISNKFETPEMWKDGWDNFYNEESK